MRGLEVDQHSEWDSTCSSGTLAALVQSFASGPFPAEAKKGTEDTRCLSACLPLTPSRRVLFRGVCGVLGVLVGSDARGVPGEGESTTNRLVSQSPEHATCAVVAGSRQIVPTSGVKKLQARNTSTRDPSNKHGFTNVSQHILTGAAVVS